ncbi:hypothetical protein OHC87_06485 [Escherichia coli]|uniref:hypothetical protein n=1 Tax=Escherichia coli TaxID=562 RepID=UPI0004D892D5|nr:hypothetical protein [Escherichia coli]KDV31731.1 hypothetical protein BU55_28320 [Escherichia coli O146:H21 str. 2010C-3325]MCW3306557.1 hypothetical protein [Escherichia coli]MCW7117015.1 hypothetical protein [Escherichia coli]
MDCAIHRVSINIFKIPFFSGIFVLNNTVAAKSDKPVLVAFILDENGILLAVFVLNKEFYVGTITACAAIFRKISIQCVIDLVVKWCLLQFVIKSIRFEPAVSPVGNVWFNRFYRLS